jgi:uncharacterized protein (DUF305 family)
MKLAAALGAVTLLLGVTSALLWAQSMPQHGQSLEALTGDDFDRAFLHQMSMHHMMALVMARPVVAQGAHPELKQLAQGMLNDQTREIEQMHQWMAAWFPSQQATASTPGGMSGHMMGPGPMMGGMPMGPGHMMGSGPMMGGMPMGPGHAMGSGPMAKPGTEQPGMPNMPGGMRGMGTMDDLWALPPNRLDAVFMAMMIPHHQGAIDMAMLALERSNRDEIKQLANAIITSQTAEIATMNGWLKDWYGL